MAFRERCLYCISLIEEYSFSPFPSADFRSASRVPTEGELLRRGYSILCYAILCYAMLCVPDVTFIPLNVTFRDAFATFWGSEPEITGNNPAISSYSSMSPSFFSSVMGLKRLSMRIEFCLLHLYVLRTGAIYPTRRSYMSCRLHLYILQVAIDRGKKKSRRHFVHSSTHSVLPTLFPERTEGSYKSIFITQRNHLQLFFKPVLR